MEGKRKETAYKICVRTSREVAHVLALLVAGVWWLIVFSPTPGNRGSVDASGKEEKKERK
jgi:hypothetical protein